MNLNASLDVHSFPLIHVVANHAFRPDDDIPDITIAPRIAVKRVSDSQPRYFCEVRVQVDKEKNPQAPYFIDVVCINFVTLECEMPEEEQHQAATVLAHLVLFPAIRELILGLTARQPWGEYSIGLANLPADAPASSAESGRRPKAPSRRKASTKVGNK